MRPDAIVTANPAIRDRGTAGRPGADATGQHARTLLPTVYCPAKQVERCFALTREQAAR